MAITSLGKTLVERENAENFLKKKNRDPDGDVTFFRTLVQGDSCVSMIGRGALRCKNAESRDVLREQLKEDLERNTSNMPEQ